MKAYEACTCQQLLHPVFIRCVLLYVLDMQIRGG